MSVAWVVSKLERSNVPLPQYRFSQSLNIPAILTPLVVLSVNPVSVIDAKLVQPWNILDRSVALLALKFVRSSPVRLEQPWNILARLVALLALREERPVNVVKLEQFLNSLAMLTPLVVLAVKPVSARDVRPVQSWNISDISVALPALKFVRLSPVRPEQPWNIPARLVALLASNPAGMVKLVRLEQSLNTPAIFTLLVEFVVTPVSVRDDRLVQPCIIFDISVALLALRFVRSKVVRLVQSWNIPDIFVISEVIIFLRLIVI